MSPANGRLRAFWVPFGPYRVPEIACTAILSGALGRGQVANRSDWPRTGQNPPGQLWAG